MQYKQNLLVLLMLLGSPQLALADEVGSTPVLVLSFGVVLLLLLALYIVVKIRQNLRNYLDKPAK